MAVQLAPWGVLLPGPVQYCSQHSCVIAVELLLQPFCQRPSSASIQQYRHDRRLEETAFHFNGPVWFPYDVYIFTSNIFTLIDVRLRRFTSLCAHTCKQNVYLCIQFNRDMHTYTNVVAIIKVHSHTYLYMCICTNVLMCSHIFCHKSRHKYILYTYASSHL